MEIPRRRFFAKAREGSGDVIDYASSLSYFEGHLKSETWSQAAEPGGTAAIAQARKILSRGLGRAMNDSEAAYSEGDTTRDEFAVYEQALFLIENGAIANGSGSGAQPILTGSIDDPGLPRTGERGLYAPEALRWLGFRGTTTIRG